MAVTARIKKCVRALLLRWPNSHQHLFGGGELLQMLAGSRAPQGCYPGMHRGRCMLLSVSTFNMTLTVLPVIMTIRKESLNIQIHCIGVLFVLDAWELGQIKVIIIKEQHPITLVLTRKLIHLPDLHSCCLQVWGVLRLGVNVSWTLESSFKGFLRQNSLCNINFSS